MIVTETKKLNIERAELYRKLDSDSNYKNESDKEIDELRIGEIESEILKIVKSKIAEAQVVEIKQIKNEVKVVDEKDARKMRKLKRDIYKTLAKECYNLYLNLVEKKKTGVELEEKLQAKNLHKYDLKKTIAEVRRY